MSLRSTVSQLFSMHSVAVVFIFVAGAYLSHSAMKSSRPSVPKAYSLVTEQEKVECRLWQDPIKAVYEQRGKADEKDGEAVIHRRGIEEQLGNYLRDQTEIGDVRVLCVMLPSGTSAGSNEDRLRSRQAVLAAIQASNLKPEESEYINYFTVDLENAADSPVLSLSGVINVLRMLPAFITGAADAQIAAEPVVNTAMRALALPFARVSKKHELAVPYEWFVEEDLLKEDKGSRAAPGRVLVLWLRDDYFLDKPIARLGKIVVELDGVLGSKAGRTFNIIGPTESTALRTMLEEEDPDIPEEIEIRMYSPWSTAAEMILTDSLPGLDSDRSRSVGQVLKGKGIRFIRTIGTDDFLVDCIIEELGRRRVFVHNRDTAIALISEWDTFYGRAFCTAFEQKVSGAWDSSADSSWYGGVSSGQVSSKGADSNIVQVFHYMRGIDGKLPTKEAVAQASAKKDPEESELTFTVIPELPMGRSQLDYARRLARSLGVRYKHTRGGRKLRAIGIVGSDVYDKLLLLHALREEFSNVLFFTTDLDTRLMHYSKFKYTRNLIVASNYGLSLNEEQQRMTMEFRDNYQTSVFFACSKAIELCSKDANELPCENCGLQKTAGRPRVFEIGRDCAVNLTVEEDGGGGVSNIHPPIRKNDMNVQSRAKRYAWGALLTLGLLILLSIYFSERLRGLVSRLLLNDERNAKECRDTFLIGISLLAALLVVVVFGYTVYREHVLVDDGEPLSFFKGVSIWPGEALRLVALILSLAFCKWAMVRLKENRESLVDEGFCLEPPVSEKPQKESVADLCKNWIGKVSVFSWRQEKDHKLTAQELWGQYTSRGTLRARLVRVIPAMALYGLFGWCIVWMFGTPNCPHRGTTSFLVDRTLLICSVVAMHFLIFFVVDATRLCARFVEILKEPTTWKETLDSMQKGAREKLSAEQMRDLEDPFDEWLDIRLIASRTEAVGKLIYYPFIVLLLMIVSRNGLFDNWNWPLSMTIIYSIDVALALYCGMKMRRSAEEARTMAVESLNRDLVLSRDNSFVGKKIQDMLDEVQSIRRGAFSPFSANPVIGAVLIPSGGLMLFALLESLSFSH